MSSAFRALSALSIKTSVAFSLLSLAGAVAFLFTIQGLGLGLLADLGLHLLSVALLALAVGLALGRGWKGQGRSTAVAGALSCAAAAVLLGTPGVATVERAQPGTPHSLLVASLNLHTDNLDMADAAAWVREHRPDVVGFVEAGSHQVLELKKLLSAQYPHSYRSKTDGIFGVVVFSKEAFSEAGFLFDGPGEQPVFRGTLDRAGLPLGIGVVHPMPPFTPEYLQLRDRNVLALADSFGERPFVLIGDFNATLTSTLMRTLGTKGVQRAPGYALYTVQPYGLVVDHVLAKAPAARRVDSGAAPVASSDHKLVWASFVGL